MIWCKKAIFTSKDGSFIGFSLHATKVKPIKEKINILDDIYFIKHGVVVKKDVKILAFDVRPYVDREKIAQYENKRGY